MCKPPILGMKGLGPMQGVGAGGVATSNSSLRSATAGKEAATRRPATAGKEAATLLLEVPFDSNQAQQLQGGLGPTQRVRAGGEATSNSGLRPAPLQQSEDHGRLRPPKQSGSQSARLRAGDFALSAQGWDITPRDTGMGYHAVPSPLAGWDRYASPFAGCNVTHRLQTSLAAESAGLTTHRDGARITSPARPRPRRAIAALPRASDGVRWSKPDSGSSVPIDAQGPQLVTAGGGGAHPSLRKVVEKNESTQAPPPDAAQRAATAHSSVAVASAAEGRENLPSTYFVPMALRTRSAGEKSTIT